MKPVQGGEPPRHLDRGPEGTASSTKPLRSPGDADDFSKHIDSPADPPSGSGAASATPPAAEPAAAPPPAQSNASSTIAAFNTAAGVNANASATPLSVSASGVEKSAGDGAPATKSTPTGRASLSGSSTVASPITTSSGDTSGVATDLSQAVQAIAGRASGEGEADADPDSTAQKLASVEPAPASAAVPGATDPQTQGALLASPLNTAASASGARAAEGPSRTVTSLSAQIIGKLGEQTTRFDVALDPIGLGRVNVQVEINAKGQMSARLSFEHAEAAAVLSRESGALRQALHDAGFQMKPEDLTFQSDGGFSDRGAASQWEDGGRSGGRSNPFGAMTSLTDAVDLSAMNAAAGRTAAGGLDIRI